MTVPLLVLVGIPGSGKSTWAQHFLMQRPHYRVVSTDRSRAQLYGDEAIQGDWRQIWQQVLTEWQQGIAAVTQGRLEGLIYDATNASRCHRRAAIAAARQLGFTRISLYWFDVPLDRALSQNQGRSRQVPVAVIERMHRQLQGSPPSLADGADEVIRLTQADLQVSP